MHFIRRIYPKNWKPSNLKRNMIEKCPYFKSSHEYNKDNIFNVNIFNENICNEVKSNESPNNSPEISLLKNLRDLCSENAAQLLLPKSEESNKEKKNIIKLFNFSLKLIFIALVLINFLFEAKNDDSPVVLKNEVWKGYEKGVGAYYTAITPLRDDYSGITGDIKLPISLNTNKGERIPYISFGVIGLINRINIGIILFNYGCTPFYHDIKNKKMKGFIDYNCPEETEIVKFKLELINSTKILFSLKYFDSNSVFLNSFSTEIDISHILVIKNNKSKFRFYRFIQLRPEKTDNQYDGTYMEKGEIKELYIIRKNISEPWGIMGRNVDVAWKVSSKHIKLHFNKNKEIFSINHN